MKHKLIIENWRKFLIKEANSSGTISKLIKLEKQARSSVASSIKDLESKHKIQITANHLYMAAGDEGLYPWSSPEERTHRKAWKKLNASLKNVETGEIDRGSIPPEYTLVWGIKNSIREIDSVLNKGYIHSIDDMLNRKRTSRIRALNVYTRMISAMFAMEKGLKPSAVYGNRMSIDAQTNIFTALDEKSIKSAKKAISTLKSKHIYTIAKIFMPDDWEAAAVNVVRICSHLLKEKFSSSEITFMGHYIVTPSHQFILDFVGGQMASQINDTLNAAISSPLDSLKYLKLHDGDDMLKETVNWINSNTTPTLAQAITMIDKILAHMKSKGFSNHNMYTSILSSKKLLLIVLS